MDLLQSLLSNIWALLLVVFFFGGSIFVHELGHFLAARRRGLVVERFSIGMGPPIWKWKGKDGVEYWIAWLPLGGYVKLPQLADLRGLEGENTIETSELPDTSYSTKLIVFLAGAVFNVIFAFLLATTLWSIGMPMDESASTTKIGFVLPHLDLPDHTKPISPAAKAGLRPGDEITAIDGSPVRDWQELHEALALGTRRTPDGHERLVTLDLKRDGVPLTISVNPMIAGDEQIRQIGITQANDVILGKIPAASRAESLGLQAGDRIESVDTKTRLYSTYQLGDYLETHADSAISLDVRRAGQIVRIAIPPHTTPQDLFKGVEQPVNVRLVHENPLEQMKSILIMTIKPLGSLINPHSDVGLSNMSGPIGIVRGFWDAATSEYPVRITMWFTILVNISLAVFNLLPLPVLDGGHILFATIGKLRGRALPATFIATTQSIFVVLILSLVVYISYFNVRSIVRSNQEEASATSNH